MFITGRRQAELDAAVKQLGPAAISVEGDATVATDSDRLLAADLESVVFTVQKALHLLNDGASVVVNASNTGSRAAAGLGVYAAICPFARTWAVELSDRGIRVNAVGPCPHVVDTGFVVRQLRAA